MSKISIDTIKRLRALTGVGITDAKQALVESQGDFDKALEAMRIKGLAKVDKRSERDARSGIVDSYVHSDRIGVLVEVNCETDFVARNQQFREFVHNVALHIAASSPLYISAEDIPAEVLKREKELIIEELKSSGRPKEVMEKIAEGKIAKYYDQVCLLNQPFIKEPEKTVGDLLKEVMAKMGENMVIRRFERMALGEVSPIDKA
ncbi:translation elongation factor Ts [Candidatus Saccharibacteria bacterium]|jgi:elongation factor Ts|nr:translation elongation factor Ts [Candidatus Saccharibacteria bacterium]